MLLMLALLASCCRSKSEISGNSSHEVKRAAFPTLSQQARERLKPAFCLPNYSAILTQQLESMQQKLTAIMQPDKAVLLPTTKGPMLSSSEIVNLCYRLIHFVLITLKL